MAGEQRTINDLPDEILLRILSHFGPEDLCFIIAEVCGRWRALSKDVTIWKGLSYKCDANSDISQVLQVLTMAPALYSLIMCGRGEADQVLITVIDRHVHLRKLIMIECCVGYNCHALFTNIVVLNPDLEALTLVGCYPMKSADYSFIPLLKKLSELNIGSPTPGMTGETVCCIADNCQALKKLTVDGLLTFVEDDVLIHVIKKLGKQLTTLVFYKGHFLNAAYSYLNECPRLQELGLFMCVNMTDEQLLDGIWPLQDLTSLRLTHGNKLTAQALSAFLDRPSMTSIVSLDLTSCYLDDEGLKGIAKRCLQLKELSVCGCTKVTDAGMSIVVRNCSQLRTLDLNELYNITGYGWLPLVPAHLPHLRLLNLKLCTSIRDQGVTELVAALPELVVIKCSGQIVGADSDKVRKAIRRFDPMYILFDSAVGTG